MMYLFERLSARPLGHDGRPEAFDEAATIMAQIQRIAATSRCVDADVAAVPWGLSSVGEIDSNATVELKRYARQLGQAIARYEPRLKGVRVTVEAERTDDMAAGHPNPPYRLVVNAIFPGESQARSLYLAAPG
jgi:predicted component of type VI protein secretion system